MPDHALPPTQRMVIDIVEQMRLLPGSHIDAGYLQGRDAVLQQLDLAFPPDEAYPVNHSTGLDTYLIELQNRFEQVKRQAEPYILPEDYLFFLAKYSGLAIYTESSAFDIYGIGPLAETDYSYLLGDMWVAGEIAWQPLGSLNFHKGHQHERQSVCFYMDLTGAVKLHSIIGIGPRIRDGSDPTILKNLSSNPTLWIRVADTFTAWLAEVAKTQGTFRI